MKTKTQNRAHKKDTTSCYKATSKGMWWCNSKGDWIYLSNFRARIVADITRDDGAANERIYDIEVTLTKAKKHVYVEAAKFQNMQWVPEQVGAAATISAAYTIKDNLRAAIQSISAPADQTVYSHLGWRRCEGKWVYLHAGGIIGQQP